MAYDLKDTSKLTVHTSLEMEKGAGVFWHPSIHPGGLSTSEFNNMYVILRGVVPFSVDCIALAWH